MLAAGLSAAVLVSLGYYPIATVNGGFIWAKHFERDYVAISNYYKNFLKTRGETTGAPELSPKELEFAALNGLVEKRLVREGARTEAGKEFGALVSNKLEGFRRNSETEKLSDVFGIKREELEEAILFPRAEREILAGRLFLRGEKLEDWLRETKAAASVVVFSSRFRWNGEEVISSN